MMYLQTVTTLLLLFGAIVARPSYENDRSRSMSSWSGWLPGGGMGMFASSADDDPWSVQPPPVWRMDEDGYPKPVGREHPAAKKPTKKKPHEEEEEDDDEDSNEHGGSRANASFNAWFPIMLGMYPGGTEEDGARSRPGGRPSSERESVAAVANSVNHGRSGVASSHAIVYGGEPETYRRKGVPQQAQYSRAMRYH